MKQEIKQECKQELKDDTMKLFKREFGFIFIGSVMFIASFLWRDLLKDVEDMIFPKNNLLSRFIYTLVVTIILAFFIIYLKRLFELNNNTNLIPDITSDPIKTDDQIASSD